MKRMSVLFFVIAFSFIPQTFAGSGGGGEERPPNGFRCDQFRTCSVDNPCPNEARAACTVISRCSTAICISKTRACMAECGTPDCNILESYPLQVSCN